MAVNETIVSGRKYRKCIDAANKIWQRISFWTKASDVEFNDGQTAEEKMGSIKGLTTNVNIDVNGYAADMKAIGASLTDIRKLIAYIQGETGLSMDDILYLLGGCRFVQEGNNFYIVGADSVRKKLGSTPRKMLYDGESFFDTSIEFNNVGWLHRTTPDIYMTGQENKVAQAYFPIDVTDYDYVETHFHMTGDGGGELKTTVSFSASKGDFDTEPALYTTATGHNYKVYTKNRNGICYLNFRVTNVKDSVKDINTNIYISRIVGYCEE